MDTLVGVVEIGGGKRLQAEGYRVNFTWGDIVYSVALSQKSSQLGLDQHLIGLAINGVACSVWVALFLQQIDNRLFQFLFGELVHVASVTSFSASGIRS